MRTLQQGIDYSNGVLQKLFIRYPLISEQSTLSHLQELRTLLNDYFKNNPEIKPLIEQIRDGAFTNSNTVKGKLLRLAAKHILDIHSGKKIPLTKEEFTMEYNSLTLN